MNGYTDQKENWIALLVAIVTNMTVEEAIIYMSL